MCLVPDASRLSQPDGKLFEARQYDYTNKKKRERRASQMDIINNTVGLWHEGEDDFASCETIRYRSVRARYIGTKREPFHWVDRPDVTYKYNRPIYRKLRSFEYAPKLNDGVRVTPTGKHCDDIRIEWKGFSTPVNPFDLPFGIKIE